MYDCWRIWLIGVSHIYDRSVFLLTFIVLNYTALFIISFRTTSLISFNLKHKLLRKKHFFIVTQGIFICVLTLSACSSLKNLDSCKR